MPCREEYSPFIIKKMFNVILIAATAASLITSYASDVNTSVFAFSHNRSSQLQVLNDEPRPIRGTIKNQAMSPVGGANVYLYKDGETTVIQSTTSSDLGTFAFNAVSPGTYQVKVVHSSYGNQTATVTVTTTDVYLNILM